jgi:DNA ligase (NAD+)
MEQNQGYEKRIKELIKTLNEASRAYYSQDREIMDNYTYDKLYDELERLENITGIHMSDSPTSNVGYEAVDELPKMEHDKPMLSLDKTKDIEALRSFIGNNRTLLSWKMDGLTIVLTYRDGSLYSAVTRGNGRIGEIVTNNAKTFKELPLKIPFKGELILRGEAFITYSDFEEINKKIEDVDAKYKNPRNLCSGSVRQLNSRITAQRNVRFKAFSLVKADGIDFENSHENEFKWLKSMGFDVVEYKIVTADNLDEAVKYFSEKVKTNEFPSDGLVALYDDIKYGESLGSTAKFPRNAYAFKWADEIRSTKLVEVEWSPSRTGLINPVAIFEPVELEGTTVTRASLHNVSILKELELGIGDEITVYKANMIIPQIAENNTRSNSLVIPDVCPACGKEARISEANGVQTLVCPNPECPAKKIKSYVLFVSRDAMNIDGMSEATLEKFIAHGLIHSYADLFRLDRYRDVIVNMEGFGEKSYEKLIAAAQRAKNTNIVRVLYAMGIPNIGLSTAKLIAEHFDGDIEKIKNASFEELCEIDKVGEIMAKTYIAWWQNKENEKKFDELIEILNIEKTPEKEIKESVNGKTFVITGSLEHFENRNALKELIESSGGKVTGSVSAKTDYLINNDSKSSSTKNKQAQKLGIPIITENEFLTLINNGG